MTQETLKLFKESTHIDPEYFLNMVVAFVNGSMYDTSGLTFMMDRNGKRVAIIEESAARFTIRRVKND